MKKTVGILGVLAILLGCFCNVAFAVDINAPISYEEVFPFEKVEITSETSIKLAEDRADFSVQGSESVNITDLENIALNDAQLIDNDILSNARATGSITWDIPAGATYWKG